MKIALVAPSSVPFVVGGAERLWWGLSRYVNQCTPHALELFKLPAPEHNFWDLVASYQRFATLDVSYFDLVISTKYPAWMVAHDRHIVYLQHTLRGLYDTYPAQLPIVPRRLPATIMPLWALLQRSPERALLVDIFGHLHQLKHASLPEQLTAFPGPFIRAIVHALDRIGLSTQAIARYYAISRTVAQRKQYVPAAARVAILPHPSDLEGLYAAPGEYVFTASRLDKAKRLDLLILAYRRTQTAIPLIIAGDGPEAARLQKLAAGDARIRLVGRLTDAALIEHYARAHLVVFVPYQEDMGLITLEAMAASKPVLTVDDAGGVTEFVRHRHNGYIVAPTAPDLAQALDHLLADPAALIRLGMAARQTAQTVTWERTVNGLLASAPVVHPPPAMVAKHSGMQPHFLVLNTFGVFPPDSGGKKRIFYLYQALSRHAEVTLLNLGAPGSNAECRVFNPRYREICIPPAPTFLRAEAALKHRLQRSVTDIAALLYYQELHQLRETLIELLATTDVVIASHIYLYPLLAENWAGILWYDAHNVELDMKADILGVMRWQAAVVMTELPPLTRPNADAVLARVAQVEATLVRRATRVLATSAADAARFADLYGRGQATLAVVPNGTHLPSAAWLEPERRTALKRQLGLPDRPIAVFIGSAHGPNLEALAVILSAARQCGGWTFWVTGSVCTCPSLATAPDNVWPLGVLPEALLTTLLHAADVGLNPMRCGSGTNLKMLDYAAHGVLIVSTERGARGLNWQPDVHFLAVTVEQLASTLQQLEPQLPAARLAIRTAARQRVAEQFTWDTIVEQLMPLDSRLA